MASLIHAPAKRLDQFVAPSLDFALNIENLQALPASLPLKAVCFLLERALFIRLA